MNNLSEPNRIFNDVFSIKLVVLFSVSAIWTASVVAAPVRLLNVPETYRPGGTFEFNVIFPEMTALSAYQVDLLLSSDQGQAGIDYSVSVVTPWATHTGYVFPSEDFFGFGTDIESSTVQRVSVADLDLAGVDVVLGRNDRVARVSVMTSASFAGDLQVKVDADALILDGPQLMPTPVEQFESIYNATIAQASIRIVAIPEPQVLGLLVISVVIGTMVCRSRTRVSAVRIN
ncbi:hypothetical protein [Roseiconus lacunae]|uniref:PEP-CTERM protein-sorting domain-containing protein n=1 Tax=Roseiconus lacunae TaxID=2605694 RepID=A0ABT7PQH6_9BACT|nr:hypothetical protein [Roseiconus lacunae]MDM4018762.1 hypothetical protein [Roseiconus lacunae]